jgi:UDPglucose 6-dehydrogenase
LKGAIGYGGPCFPRDNVALSYMARALGTEAAIAETTDRFNRAIPERIVARLRPLIGQGSTVAVLGLAYKPYSHVVEESQGVYLAKALSHAGARVVGYDPLAGETAKAELAYHALVLDSMESCLAQADVVVITTPDPVFKKLTANDFQHRPVTVMDCWRLLSKELSGEPGVQYLGIGQSIDDAANTAQVRRLWDHTAQSSA